MCLQYLTNVVVFPGRCWMKPRLCSWNCFHPFPEKKRAVTPAHCIHPRTEGSSCCPSPRHTWCLFCQAWAQLHRGPQSSLWSCAQPGLPLHQQHGEGSPVPHQQSHYSGVSQVPEQLFDQLSFFQRLHMEQFERRGDPQL